MNKTLAEIELEAQILEKWAHKINEWYVTRLNVPGLRGEDFETLRVFLVRMLNEQIRMRENAGKP
jgi:hypothetical protein